jgi:thiosulfate/3-mercaptopyruvate sulfurtransferase
MHFGGRRQRMSSAYAHPEVLVDAEWADRHLADPGVRFIEVDVDTSSYSRGHLPGAVAFNWTTQLQDPVRRDILSREQFEALGSSAGLTPEATVVLYGDHHNWFAAYAYWLFKLYGHRDVRLLDGGRGRWEREGRALTTAKPQVPRTVYSAQPAAAALRSTRDEVLAGLGRADRVLVDVRSPQEWSGELLAPPGLPETAQRAGHVPGAQNIPWSQAVREDGTFRPAEELRELYGRHGVVPERDVVTYCRIGERSSHTWFVLRELLGFPRVRNYDGSWTEWGSSIGLPIENPHARTPDTSEVCA